MKNKFVMIESEWFPLNTPDQIFTARFVLKMSHNTNAIPVYESDLTWEHVRALQVSKTEIPRFYFKKLPELLTAD